MWAGATLDPNRGNASFRQVAGDLDFVNVPLSVDVSAVEDRGGRKFHWDLQPDWQVADYSQIARNIVAQVRDRNPRVPVVQRVPVVHMVTHNDDDFSDDNDRVCRNYETVLSEIGAAIREVGAEPVGATFADIVELVRQGDRTNKQFVFADKTMLTG